MLIALHVTAADPVADHVRHPVCKGHALVNVGADLRQLARLQRTQGPVVVLGVAIEQGLNHQVTVVPVGIVKGLELDATVVVDPVMVATSGARLLDEDAIESLKGVLGRASLVTPNLPEARILAELPEGTADECAAKLSAYCQHLLITGGHGDEAEVHNRLYVRGGDCHTFTCARLPGSYHGSGCTLASTLAGRLALGEEVVSAVRSALDYTWRTLRDAEQPGHGQFVPRRLPLDFCS